MNTKSRKPPIHVNPTVHETMTWHRDATFERIFCHHRVWVSVIYVQDLGFRMTTSLCVIFAANWETVTSLLWIILCLIFFFVLTPDLQSGTKIEELWKFLTQAWNNRQWLILLHLSHLKLSCFLSSTKHPWERLTLSGMNYNSLSHFFSPKYILFFPL